MHHLKKQKTDNINAVDKCAHVSLGGPFVLQMYILCIHTRIPLKSNVAFRCCRIGHVFLICAEQLDEILDSFINMKSFGDIYCFET